jgi:cell division protein FtsW
MTLPFISIGGSSTLAVSLGLGMLLALGRRRASHAKKSAFAPMPARSGTV